ncbi:hypothetical protein J27TS8_01130 [Robertmurraya siralis]|uniref:Uncharacterized protein n=1 Tax=Robertmurraya siralis TaxID=77777 RepID=A0A919WDV3_9BACI|nr:hypothetical protein [Robertmurraya siralis]PAE18401.1 hypothetical protein CHH80_22000 [Bacillus sp. 7504-2]GIN60120.1 hypothetical protein J27TS8_01130 [Robertmurraya siralis]
MFANSNLMVLYTITSAEGAKIRAVLERLNLNAGDNLKKKWQRILLGISGILIFFMVIGAISFYSL